MKNLAIVLGFVALWFALSAVAAVLSSPELSGGFVDGARGGCTLEFPVGEGNPWRVEATSASELTKLLWKVDSDPRLESMSIFAESQGCFIVAWKQVSE